MAPYCSKNLTRWAFTFERGFCTCLVASWQAWCDVGDSLRQAEWVPWVVLSEPPCLVEQDATAEACILEVAGQDVEVLLSKSYAEKPVGVSEFAWSGTRFGSLTPGTRSVHFIAAFAPGTRWRYDWLGPSD